MPIQYSIRGSDLNSLTAYSKQIVSEFSKLPGIVDVDTSLEAGKPEIRVYINRDKAADLGVSVTSIAEAINVLISGESISPSSRKSRKAGATKSASGLTPPTG